MPINTIVVSLVLTSSQKNEHRAGLSQPTMNVCAVGIELTLLLPASGCLKPLMSYTLNSTIRCVNKNVLNLKLVNQLTTRHIKTFISVAIPSL